MGFLRWSLSLSALLYSFVIYSFRAKYHKLKFGTDLNQGEKKADLSEQGTRPFILPWPPPGTAAAWHREVADGLCFLILFHEKQQWP